MVLIVELMAAYLWRPGIAHSAPDFVDPNAIAPANSQDPTSHKEAIMDDLTMAPAEGPLDNTPNLSPSLKRKRSLEDQDDDTPVNQPLHQLRLEQPC